MFIYETRHFECIYLLNTTSFNPLKPHWSPMREVLLLTPFTDEGTKHWKVKQQPQGHTAGESTNSHTVFCNLSGHLSVREALWEWQSGQLILIPKSLHSLLPAGNTSTWTLGPQKICSVPGRAGEHQCKPLQALKPGVEGPKQSPLPQTCRRRILCLRNLRGKESLIIKVLKEARQTSRSARAPASG